MDEIFRKREHKSKICKETFMHIPFMYHFCGRPDKSSAAIRDLIGKAYRAGRSGIPDNEDMGCHSAMYMCGLLGLYPMMGQELRCRDYLSECRL